jgi:hypothetical protein
LQSIILYTDLNNCQVEGGREGLGVEGDFGGMHPELMIFGL